MQQRTSEITLSTGEHATLMIDENGDRTLIPYEGGNALSLRDSEGDADRIDHLLGV